MNNQDYEHKKKAYWLQFCREKGVDQEINISIYEAFDSIFDSAYALGKQTEAITQEEIEKAATEFADKEYEIGEVDWDALHKGYYHGMKDALGKREKEVEEAAINGWMARDKNGGLVCCAGSKPFKEEKLPFWRVDYRNFIECIPNDLFLSLTWDDDPMEVEITIKPKKRLSTK